jgi:hypothetical protein
MSRIVRPGRTYILLSEQPITARYDFVSACKVDCDGIHAVMLSVPEQVPFDAMIRLQQLGVQVARTVRIFPAGLSARGFDGEGHTEWLTTEAPCFGIVHDHPVDTYTLRLNAESEIRIDAPSASTPVFVRIAPLSVGRHTLMVKAHRSEAQGSLGSAFAEGVITLDVREPEPWTPGTTSHAGLAITLEPDAPSLDEFWEGHTSVSVLGPAGHQVVCEVQLFSASGKELLSEPVATFDLPITPTDWKKKLSLFTSDDRSAWSCAEATSGRFLIKGEELGTFALRLERDVKPLRWVCRNLPKETTIRLIDDTGSEQVPACRFFSFRTPAAAVSLDSEIAVAGSKVDSPGGLFQACVGKVHDDVIVSLPLRVHGFTELLIEPDVSALEVEATSPAAVIEALRQWSGARLLGPLVTLHRDRIVERIADKLYARLCGPQWAEAEKAYLDAPRAGFARQRLLDTVGAPHAFSVALSHENDRMDEGTESGTAWFFRVAAHCQVSLNQGICDFALRIAGCPQDVPDMVPTQSLLDALLSDVEEKKTLLRGARLVALLCASRNPGPYGGIFPRWNW